VKMTILCIGMINAMDEISERSSASGPSDPEMLILAQVMMD